MLAGKAETRAARDLESASAEHQEFKAAEQTATKMKHRLKAGTRARRDLEEAGEVLRPLPGRSG